MSRGLLLGLVVGSIAIACGPAPGSDAPPPDDAATGTTTAASTGPGPSASGGASEDGTTSGAMPEPEDDSSGAPPPDLPGPPDLPPRCVDGDAPCVTPPPAEVVVHTPFGVFTPAHATYGVWLFCGCSLQGGGVARVHLPNPPDEPGPPFEDGIEIGGMWEAEVGVPQEVTVLARHHGDVVYTDAVLILDQIPEEADFLDPDFDDPPLLIGHVELDVPGWSFEGSFEATYCGEHNEGFGGCE